MLFITFIAEKLLKSMSSRQPPQAPAAAPETKLTDTPPAVMAAVPAATPAAASTATSTSGSNNNYTPSGVAEPQPDFGH